MGTLYLVSTPIGNLEDLSIRAIRLLGEADVVLAEDTRRTGRLLRHLELATPLLSLHAHNEAKRGEEVSSRLSAAETLVLVSDAGTPLISDPGERLVRRVIEEGHRVVPVPGPSAVLHALIGSGLSTTPFTFLGFVPRKGRARTALIERVIDSGETVVLFESPERTSVLLRELAEKCGPERRAAVARELSKLHEEFRRGSLGELADKLGDGPLRGEITLVVAAADADRSDPGVDEDVAILMAKVLLDRGVSRSRIARELARRLGVSRNQAYEVVQRMPAATGPSDAPDSNG